MKEQTLPGRMSFARTIGIYYSGAETANSSLKGLSVNTASALCASVNSPGKSVRARRAWAMASAPMSSIRSKSAGFRSGLKTTRRWLFWLPSCCHEATCGQPACGGHDPRRGKAER